MTQPTRRSFLKHTATGAAGVYASISFAGTQATGAVVGANDTINVGVAGIHGRGGAHIGAFSKMDNVEVTYLIDPDSRLFGRRKGRQTCVQDVRFSKQSKAFGDDKEAYRSFEWIQDTLKDNGLKLEETTYRLGRKLRLDPEKERFIGDEEANRLLTREYRSPFVVPDTV